MSEKRFFDFVEFGAWVRSQVQTLTDYLNLELSEVNTRMDGVDQTLLNKADQSALDSTNQAVATKANQNEVSDALDTKLDATATAVDSAKLEGSSKAQVVTEAVAAAEAALADDLAGKLNATATAADSAKLEGSTKAQVVAEAVAGSADAIAAKLGKTEQAADSAKLEGRTKAQVISDVQTALNLGTASTANIFVSTVDPIAAGRSSAPLPGSF